jgi:hypothetical protein
MNIGVETERLKVSAFSLIVFCSLKKHLRGKAICKRRIKKGEAYQKQYRKN